MSCLVLYFVTPTGFSTPVAYHSPPPTRLGDLFGPHDWGIPPPHHRLYDAEAEETASRVRVYDPQRERWYNHRRR